MIWYNESAKFGLAFDYQAIVLHALVEGADSNWDVYMQVEAGKLILPDTSELTEQDYDPEDGQDDCLTWDVTFSVGLKDVADRVFHYVTTSSASELLPEDDEHCFGDDTKQNAKYN
jgi:nitric oxide reductase large subunit